MEDRTWTAPDPRTGAAKRRTQDRGTFLVKIMYRQNHSWQGEVIWAETNEHRYFRSALELLKLIDTAAADCGWGGESAKDESGEE